MVKEKLRKILTEAVKRAFLKIKQPDFEIEEASKKEFGDYSSNLAFSLSRLVKNSPAGVAQKIVENLPCHEMIERGEVQDGFINFRLKKEWLQKQVGEILTQGKRYGGFRLGQGKKVIVEFISANPTGPLTLGNGRGGFYGDALARVLEKVGFKVIREYYINDSGGQIEALGFSLLKIQNPKLKTPTRYLKKLYQGSYLKELAQRVKENDPQKAGEKAARLILEESIKKDLDELEIKFNRFVSEKALIKSKAVQRALDQLKKKSLIYEKEGALWFCSTQFGDDQDRVVVRRDGQLTYFATDIAYHLDKLKRADKAVNLWGADHFGYVPRLKGALQALGLGDKLEIIITQLVRLVARGQEMKISKRAGTFLTLRELVDEVGADAVRYFFISVAPHSHLDFDLELAKEQSEKNPVYYLQYVSARIHGILAKAKAHQLKINPPSANFKLLDHPAEIELIKQLIRYPDLIEEIASTYQVYQLAHYTYALARAFHNFYEKCQVISGQQSQSSRRDKERARLSLVLAAQIILKDALGLMGIKAPAKM